MHSWQIEASLRSALNTLLACKAQHGARALFDELRASPEGPVSRRYLSGGFAAAAAVLVPLLARAHDVSEHGPRRPPSVELIE